MNTDLSSLDDPGIRSVQSLQDRNRLRVPLAFARWQVFIAGPCTDHLCSYIHSFALRGVRAEDNDLSDERAGSIKVATSAALQVVRMSLDAKMYQVSLSSSMVRSVDMSTFQLLTIRLELYAP